MPIRTQLLKKWVGPDPEKHIGSTSLRCMTNPRQIDVMEFMPKEASSQFL